MKPSIQVIRNAALAALLVLTASTATFAATSFVDQNGGTAGLWDGLTTPIGIDLVATPFWTTTAAGTAATTVFTAGNNMQVGVASSDFNGATIIITNDINGSIGGSPAFLSIVSTNVTVDFIGTSVNERFNHATTLAVTNGSTLNLGGNNYNYNSQLFTFAGNGTINVSNVLGNNETSQGITVNMIGGKLFLYQTAAGTFGNATTGHGFTLSNGVVSFVSPQSFSTVFSDFQAGADQTVKFNGGTIDNLSGAPGTLNVNLGSYGIGGNFTYAGTSQSMSLGNAGVSLTVSPQITVGGNTFTIGGIITDNGAGLGITKAGNGILALTGASVYSGPTVVNAGQLIANTTSTGTGDYSVSDSATLGIKVAAVGQTLNMNNLTVGVTTGATLQFDVGLLGNPTVSPVRVNGTLTINGAANPISLASISAVTNFPTIIPLITYNVLVGNPANLTFGSMPSGTPPFQGYISNDVTSQTIDLVLTNGQLTLPPGNPKAVTWIGSPTGNWDTTTFNWNASGTVTNYANLTLAGSGDPVTFDDSLTGTTNVNLTTALSPASVTLGNNSSNYVFSGTGKITGATTLTLNGSKNLLLDNLGKNDFTGAITINSGLLQIGNNDTNGNPGTGPILNNGALVFNRTDATLGVSAALGAISGSGFITNNGSGTLTIGGVQPFAGMFVVNAGTVNLAGPNSNPSTLSACTNLTINGGTVQFQNDNVDGTTMPGIAITVNATGVLTGNGTSSHLPGTFTLNGGTLRMDGNQNNTANGTWDLNNGVVVPGGPVTSTISALNVIPNQGGGTIFNIASGTTPSGVDLLVSGSLINGTSAHDTGITKNGAGTMVLDNNNTYIVGTTINGGVLRLGAAGDAAVLTSPLGAGPVSITGGSTLNLSSSKGLIITNVIGDDSTGIVLASTGTNTLTAANTYSGKTIVSSGSFVLANGGSINGSASVSVNNSIFDISTGGAMVSGGALALTNTTFNLGTNSVTSIGSLGVSNTMMNFVITPGVVNITVSGGFATGGSTNVINLTAVPGFTSYPTNIPLIKYGSFGNVDGQNRLTKLGLTLPALGSPVGYLTNDLANGSIDLVLQSNTLLPILPIAWNGQTNGINVSTWDILTTTDWVLASDHVTPYSFQNTTPVTFDDTAHGNGSVNLTATVLPLSVNIGNAAKTYTIAGTGSIGGSTSVVKANSGTATLAETGGDSFAGGVFVSGGTLVLSNASAGISGGVTVSNGTLVLAHSGTINGGLVLDNTGGGTPSATVLGGGTLNGGVTTTGGSVLLDQTGNINGNLLINSGIVRVGNNDTNGNLPSGALTNNDTLIFNRTDTNLNVLVGITGTGALTNNGTGTVKFSGTNTYTGPTTINAGIVVTAGGNGPASGFHGSSLLTINNGAQVQVLVDNSLAGRGTPGILPIVINAGGLLTGAPGANNGNGTSTHIQGLLTLNGGALTNSGTSTNTANGSWDLDDGVATSAGPVTSTIGSLSVVPSQSGGTMFNVIAGTTPSGVDLDVVGTIIHATAQPDTGINMIGNGTLRMSNTNSYSGATTLTAGTLVANAPENGIVGPLGAPAGAINFNGGTLRYSAVNSFDYSARFAAGGFYNIDTAGQNVAFATALSSGSLTKLGNGTLALSGANTYSGDTVVGRGKLITSTASTGSGNYTATNSATLDIQVAAPATQLTVNNLTLGAAGSDTSTLQIDSLAAGNPTAAPVNIIGATATNGTVNISLLGTALTAGTPIPLIAYTGTSFSSALHFVPPVGFTGVLSDNGSSLISVTLTAAAVGPTTNAAITKVTLSGTNLLVHGTNNNVPNTGFHYVVLTTANLTNALTNWTPVFTNSFNPDGTFDYTNPIVPGTPRQFIDVKAVP